ncbi:hypothetical protein NONO_c35540 [Nocardia nova SH22a]|uniref:Uncharacterized protein n=1 Tax=Nocardia nova SH22a TaxID=1415166 RepID=W5TM67_9NOCA|nr:hypothetical protein NONO_c35540 [Nocardia nova SH22a]
MPRKPLCVNRGRELRKFRELEEQAARTGTPLLLAVSGGSGIGKTTLIVTAAYELGSRYPDVLFAADAAGNIGTPADSNDVAAVLLVQLGVPWQDIPAPHLRLPVLRSKLGGRQLLLVLDDIRSAEQVLPLLGDLRHAAVVVAGERHLDRLRIAGFESLKLKGFEPGEGADYLVAMAGPEVAEADRAVLERLVVLCGGVPQLVAAAAATLADGAEPIDEYVQRLERAATLDELSDDLRIDNECVVDTVGDAGYDGLTDDEARAYRWLSMHPGTCFDLGFAAALLELPVPRVRRLIRGWSIGR